MSSILSCYDTFHSIKGSLKDRKNNYNNLKNTILIPEKCVSPVEFARQTLASFALPILTVGQSTIVSALILNPTQETKKEFLRL